MWVIYLTHMYIYQHNFHPFGIPSLGGDKLTSLQAMVLQGFLRITQSHFPAHSMGIHRVLRSLGKAKLRSIQASFTL